MKRHIVSCGLILLTLTAMFGARRAMSMGYRMLAEVLAGGFHVTYYRDPDFGHPIGRASERHARIDYRNRRPLRSMQTDGFSARWEGWLLVPESGEYSFFLQVNGGARVYIDDALVADHWDSPGWHRGRHASAPLTAGPRKIRVDYVDRTERGALRLRWTGRGVAPNTVMGVPHVTKRRPANEP